MVGNISVDDRQIPRAYTVEEVQKMFILHCKEMVVYWLRVNCDLKEKLNGLLFSILCTIDGDTLGLPTINLMLSPHPEDREFHIQEGENYFEDGMIINDNICLHEML